MKKSMTCIVCPMGCSLEVEYEGTEVSGIKGNQCARGEKYALMEIGAPVRTVTTTLEIWGGTVSRLPVKTSKPIGKRRIFDIVKLLAEVKATAPIKAGQIIIADVCGTGADIVATADIELYEFDSE